MTFDSQTYFGLGGEISWPASTHVFDKSVDCTEDGFSTLCSFEASFTWDGYEGLEFFAEDEISARGFEFVAGNLSGTRTCWLEIIGVAVKARPAKAPSIVEDKTWNVLFRIG